MAEIKAGDTLLINIVGARDGGAGRQMQLVSASFDCAQFVAQYGKEAAASLPDQETMKAWQKAGVDFFVKKMAELTSAMASGGNTSAPSERIIEAAINYLAQSGVVVTESDPGEKFYVKPSTLRVTATPVPGDGTLWTLVHAAVFGAQ